MNMAAEMKGFRVLIGLSVRFAILQLALHQQHLQIRGFGASCQPERWCQSTLYLWCSHEKEIQLAGVSLSGFPSVEDEILVEHVPCRQKED